MKRAGFLYDGICDMDNIRLAFWKAQRGKATRRSVIAFRSRLNDNLAEIRNAFASGDFKLGNYTCFPVFDPKERMICAAPFRERVMHHAAINVCAPFFEKRLIHDTYACIKGRGLDPCLDRARSFCRRFERYLKMDVHKYFDSISHDRLESLMRKYFKDARLLGFFDAVIDTYEKAPGRGIPIGNLTSQYFANAYLCAVDRLAKETLRVGGYVRYMDDFVLFSDSADELKAARKTIREFCKDALDLELNEPGMNRCESGLKFLGYVLRPGSVRLTLRAKRRFKRKMAEAERADDGRKAQALLSFLKRADASGFIRKTILGSPAEGANRVNRGGSWNNNARNCRPANRDRNEPGNRNNNLGFRVALAPSSRTWRMPFSGQAGGPVAREGDEKPRPAGLVDGADAPAERPAEPFLRK